MISPSLFLVTLLAGLAGADPTEVELCFVGTLDPAKVTGKIVLCRRGVNARVDKSLAVKNAGGVFIGEGSPEAIGDYVGHRSPSSTEIYSKVAIESLRELALGDGEGIL